MMEKDNLTKETLKPVTKVGTRLDKELHTWEVK